MSYKQRITTKVLKTLHEVTFRSGQLAGTLKADLARVPGNAKLISIDESDDCGQCTLMFEDEVEAE